MMVRKAGVSVALATVFVLVATSSAAARPHHQPRPCEATGIVDWICPLLGHVFEDGSGLRQGRLVRLDGSTTLLAAPGAEASVGFKQQARCLLGPSSSPSEIVTRSPEEADLFRQLKGRTQCRITHNDADVGFFCEVTDKCPAVLTANGEFIARNVDYEAAASSDEGIERTKIVICTGFGRVRVEDEHGFSEASGGATGNNQFVVIIERSLNSIFIHATSTYHASGACHSTSAALR